ncbi:hypothetical protein N0V85_007962 [Neurospora sp. IMI 360204]|nr:hypothetical protein N0V85_007962 [Neurospora sp. IMI 360204]
MYSQEPMQTFLHLLRNVHEAGQFGLLEQWWKIIRSVAIQDNLINTEGHVMALHELKNWDDAFDNFAMRAYDWLHMHMECGSSESAIRSIAFTRPHMERATRDLASDEVCQNKRITRNDNEVINREYKGLIKSQADFWVQDARARAMTMCNHATTEETTRDIRRLPRDQVEMDKKMVDALKDMADKRMAKSTRSNN